MTQPAVVIALLLDPDAATQRLGRALLACTTPFDLTVLCIAHPGLEILLACDTPEPTSLYDAEGVEGWVWTHPDGRTWTTVGDWCHPAPLPFTVTTKH